MFLYETDVSTFNNLLNLLLNTSKCRNFPFLFDEFSETIFVQTNFPSKTAEFDQNQINENIYTIFNLKTMEYFKEFLVLDATC